MIGSSDGKAYESQMDVELGKPWEPPEGAVGTRGKATGASKSDLGTEVAPIVDRTKDVPLAASALHKDGQMYGIAIDKDAPHKPEYDQYIYKHEADEFGYMKDLMTNGMSSTEAYHKAHDHITPMESARVQADLGEKGLEDYKQYWRDVASVSTKKENPDRHPDAHTTTFGLDEAELGKKFKVAIDDRPKGETPFQRMEETHGIGHATMRPLSPLNPPTNAPLAKLPTGGGKLPESIYTAAIRTPEGKVYHGINHGEAAEAILNERGSGFDLYGKGVDQGFVTNEGRFVSRHEALEIADQAKQIPKIDRVDKYTQKYWKGLGLISEDLERTDPRKEFFKNLDKPK